MELVEKGQSANVDPFQQLMVEMSWGSAADFDLAAVLEKKSGGEPDLIYFNNMGNLNPPVCVKLDKDAGVGDTVDSSGRNKETMKITSLESYNKIHLLAWDYGAIGKGAARFKESDVQMAIVDDKGNSHSAKVDTGDMGHVCCVATIDNTSPIGAKFVNASIVGTLKEFADIKVFASRVVTESAA